MSASGTSGPAPNESNIAAAAASPDAKTAAQAPPKYLRPNFETMPAELKPLKIWLLWVPIWNGSKWTKRPIQRSGYGASATNPRHWSSFEEVKQVYEHAVERGYIEVREKGEPPKCVPIAGVGFVFDGQPDEEGLVIAGVDFDNVISADYKEIASLAVERIKRLNSYCERSVSGRGLHCIVKARPLRAGIAHGGVEMYTKGRFFTMTGAPRIGPIARAPDEFAALAEELRAQSKASRTGEGDHSPGNSEHTAGTTTDAWFGKLPPEKQSEVVEYAAQYLAKNTKLFELTAHGGIYLDYVRQALAIARSGVPDAEDIFVRAASTAKEADPEDELRRFFQNCDRANPSEVDVTIGTLFYAASQNGADFSKWKQIADNSDPNVALFVPGNEDECRKRLDRVVAADPQTFTLGDPTGPLVILRAPDKDALPENTKWEGDLPGTTLATPADIMQRAEQLVWKQRAGGKGGRIFRTHPPRQFVSDYLIQRRGQFAAPPLRGIVRVPRIDDNGEVRCVPGYDPLTGLFHDRSLPLDVAPNPSHDDARRAVEVLLLPFSKYHFDDPAAGNAMLLAAIFTAIERPFLPLAPMFVVSSSMPGTGKGLIVRSLVQLAFDTAPVIVTWGGSSEEFEKRLGGLLLQAPGALSIDNANGMQIQGDLLESIITEGCADIRPLGHSEIVKVRCRSLLMLSGNNPTIMGDMARRTLRIDILPRSADPERDCYPFHPVKMIRRYRPDLLRAVFLAMRAFRFAGMPRQGLPAVGSFDEWSLRVRDLVYWLTGCDISEGFHQNKAEDPRRQADGSLLAALHQHFGANPFTAAEVIAVHQNAAAYGLATPTERALRAALDDVFGGNRGVNSKLFGYWARRLNGAHNGGFVLETKHDPAANANVITVRRMQRDQPPGSTEITGTIYPLHKDQK